MKAAKYGALEITEFVALADTNALDEIEIWGNHRFFLENSYLRKATKYNRLDVIQKWASVNPMMMQQYTMILFEYSILHKRDEILGWVFMNSKNVIDTIKQGDWYLIMRIFRYWSDSFADGNYACAEIMTMYVNTLFPLDENAYLPYLSACLVRIHHSNDQKLKTIVDNNFLMTKSCNLDSTTGETILTYSPIDDFPIAKFSISTNDNLYAKCNHQGCTMTDDSFTSIGNLMIHHHGHHTY